MKQVILSRPGEIIINEVPEPEPSEGEVVIRINCALTCGTDLKAYTLGHKLIPMPGPFGHEYSGTIAKTGRNVREFKEGDDVMGVHSAPCMECRYCKKDLHNLCEVIMQNKVLGAFSEYLLLPAGIVRLNLFHKPDNLSFHEGALLEPLSCVVHPYEKVMFGNIENSLVIGAGPIGLMHTAYLKMNGLKVKVSDIFDERLSIAAKMGADTVKSRIDTAHSVREATGGIGVDLLVECTGQINVWEDAVNYVRRGGTVILFGGCPAGTKVNYDTHRLHYDELTLLGSFHYSPQDVKTAYQMLKGKKMDLSPLISGEYPLGDIDKVFNLLERGKGIKYALKP